MSLERTCKNCEHEHATFSSEPCYTCCSSRAGVRFKDFKPKTGAAARKPAICETPMVERVEDHRVQAETMQEKWEWARKQGGLSPEQVPSHFRTTPRVDPTAPVPTHVLLEQTPEFWDAVHREYTKGILQGAIAKDAPAADPVPVPKENTGGSVSYYKIRVHKPISGGPVYDAECNDIIEALQMNFAEGNAFKAIWRSCAARGGMSKELYSGSLYDAEKVVFFGKRMVKQATPYNEEEGEKPC